MAKIFSRCAQVFERNAFDRWIGTQYPNSSNLRALTLPQEFRALWMFRSCPRFRFHCDRISLFRWSQGRAVFLLGQ